MIKLGSLPRRQTFLNQLRGDKVPLLVVDGGDCFFLGTTIKAPTKSEETRDLRGARVILGAYNRLGYQALGIGPGDLQYGLERLRELERDARFPFLCANIVEKASGRTIFKPHVIIEASGLKVGVYSVIMGSLNETFVKRVLPGAEVRDPIETTRRIVSELEEKCDLILALSHLNADQNDAILEAKLGIDMLVDPLAHSGTKSLWVAEDDYCRMRSGTLVLRVDGQGSRVGVLELYFQGEETKPAGFRGYDMPLEPQILRHPDMTRLVDLLRQGKMEPGTVSFDPADLPLVGDFLGAEGCGGCHEEQLAFWKGTRHATAFSTLQKSEEQDLPECFICHSYGYGVTFVGKTDLGKFKDVQCESCHGMSADHAGAPQNVRLGPVAEEACWGCHNHAITGKPFSPSEALPAASCPKMKR